jgi:hypothetical protein
MQVALSGVFASKEAAEEASVKHQKALAEFCETQSKELKDVEKRSTLRGQFTHDLCDEPGYFKSELTVVEMPMLTESPSTNPKYKLERGSLRVMLSGAPNDGIFAGPMEEGREDMISYRITEKPKTYCRMLYDKGGNRGGRRPR